MDPRKMSQALSTALTYLSQDQVLLATGFAVGAVDSVTLKQCLEQPLSSLLNGSVTGAVCAGIVYLISRICPKPLRAVFPAVLVASMIYCKLNKKTIKVSTKFNVAE